MHDHRLVSPPAWFDVSMWGKPLDTCMMNVRFREKFQDALAVVISDQERAGLDLSQPAISIATKTLPGDPGITIHPALGGAGRRLPSGRGNPQRVAPLSARHALERNLHRLALAPRSRQDRAPPAGLSQDLADGPGPRKAAGEVRHLLLAGHDALSGHPHAQVQRQAANRLGHGRGHEQGAAGPPRRRLQAASRSRSPASTSWPTPSARTTPRRATCLAAYNREVEGPGQRRLWIHTCWGNPNMQRVREDTSYAASMEMYLHEAKGDVWTVEMKDRNFKDIELFERFKDSEEKGRRRDRQPPQFAGRSPGGRGRGNPPRAQVHSGGAADRVHGLRLRATGLQSRDRLLQGLGDRPGLQHRPPRAGSGGEVYSRRRRGTANGHRAAGVNRKQNTRRRRRSSSPRQQAPCRDRRSRGVRQTSRGAR